MLTASGYIVARREAIVSSKIQGRLLELRVEEGSQVQNGEVIARLESTDFVASVARAQAQIQQATATQSSADASIQRAEADVAEARRQLGVSERLIADKLVPRDQLDANKSRVTLAEAVLAQARAERQRSIASVTQAEADLTYANAQLQNTVIRAPFSGTVVRKMAEVGESVAPIPPGVNISTASGAIVALADLATLEMEADVNEANVAKLVEGQPAEITVEAFPDRKYKAVLRQVIPTADRTKATVLTKVTLIDKDKDLKPEMSAKVTFLEPQRADAPVAVDAAPAKPVILVPQSAVVTRDGGPKVFEVVGDRVHMRTVTTGAHAWRSRDRHRWPGRQRDAGRQACRDSERRRRCKEEIGANWCSRVLRGALRCLGALGASRASGASTVRRAELQFRRMATRFQWPQLMCRAFARSTSATARRSSSSTG